jgi:hypothetical protein
MGLRSVSDEVSDNRRQHRRTLPDSWILSRSTQRRNAGPSPRSIRFRTTGLRSDRIKINALLYPHIGPDMVANVQHR